MQPQPAAAASLLEVRKLAVSFDTADGIVEAVRGVNLVGLQRRAFPAARLGVIKKMHRLLYRQGNTLEAARSAIAALAGEVPEAASDVAQMNAFLAGSTRGIAR